MMHAPDDVLSLDLRLTYDPPTATVVQVQAGSLASGMMLAANVAQPGVIRASLAGGYPTTGEGPVVAVTFGTSAGVTLSLEEARVNEGALPAATTMNTPPTLMVPPDQTINELAALTVTNTATDADLPTNSLTFGLVSGPAGMNVDPVTGVLTWTPDNLQGPSTNLVTVNVSDNGVPSLSTTKSFSVVVADMKTITGTTRYYALGQVVSGAVLTLGRDGSQCVIAGSDGAYAFRANAGSNYTVTPSKSNDITPNRGITTADITLVRRHILAVARLNSPYKIIAADVNGDKSVTTADITLIRRVILAVNTSFPAGLWRFVSSDFTFGDPANPWSAPFATNRQYMALGADESDQDYLAIKSGDVNADWTAGGTGLVSAPPTVPGEVGRKGPSPESGRPIFYAGEQVVAPGDILTVPIRVGGFADVTSVQFTLAWDPTVLQFLSLTSFGLPGLGAGNFNAQLEGRLACSWDDPGGTGVTTNDGVSLFSVQFKAWDTNGAWSPLAFENVPTPCEVTVNSEVTPGDWQNGRVTLAVAQPRCVLIRTEVGGLICIAFAGAPGRTYGIECCETPGPANWVSLGSRAADAQGSFELVENAPPGVNSRFYRAVYPAPAVPKPGAL